MEPVYHAGRQRENKRLLSPFIPVYSQCDAVLDFLLRIQRKSFWSECDAPRLRVSASDANTGPVRAEAVVNLLRRSAVYGIAWSGTERALEILGTGAGIDDDMRLISESYFGLAARSHVGIYRDPEMHGGALPEEKEAAVKSIYARFGKTYTPIRPTPGLSPAHPW